MKKTYILLLMLTTALFAQEKSELLSTKNIHILEGTIDNQYPITMHLTIEENTQKVNGQYYYNNNKTPIYLGESVLNKNLTLTLKEYTNSYPDAYNNSNSTGEFTGKLDKKMIFKGTWSNGKKSFDFEVKPNKEQIIQEIQIKKHSFTTNLNTSPDNINPEIRTFEHVFETLQIANPKKLVGINKINTELGLINDFNDYYPAWKECVYDALDSWSINQSYNFVYRDNSIVSLVAINDSYTGGAHGNGLYQPIVYSLDSGKVLNEKINDLIYSIEDEKLIALLQKKSIDSGLSPDDSYFKDMRLNDNYSVNTAGISFVYYIYWGYTIIYFTYEELKPFIRKESKLYYLFE